MSAKRRGQPAEAKGSRPAPKYIVSYAAMMTILLAFFIMLNNLATVREYGLVGRGLGLFRKSFNSFGLPGILPGSRTPKGLKSVGGKFVPQDVPSDEWGRPLEGRLVDPDEHDLQDTVTALLNTDRDVILPLPIDPARDLDQETQRRLASLARLIRLSDCEVQVRATLVAERRDLRPAWREAAALAQRVGDYLCSRQGIPAERVVVVAKVRPAPAEEEGRPGREASGIAFLLRPRGRAAATRPSDSEELVPLIQKPRTIRRIVR